ncbi:tail protein [Moraxella phage Mcat26]|nr:tail protein [Moraxella phage Mcat25]AKI28131.1 tail protein [Moraxella phage Mcat26]
MAGHLGKTVGELEATMSASELSEWLAYDRLDPIGGYRGDIQSAVIACAMAGGKPSDYLIIDPNPMTDEEREAYELEQQKAELQAQMERTLAMFSTLG